MRSMLACSNRSVLNMMLPFRTPPSSMTDRTRSMSTVPPPTWHQEQACQLVAIRQPGFQPSADVQAWLRFGFSKEAHLNTLYLKTLQADVIVKAGVLENAHDLEDGRVCSAPRNVGSLNNLCKRQVRMAQCAAHDRLDSREERPEAGRACCKGNDQDEFEVSAISRKLACQTHGL